MQTLEILKQKIKKKNWNLMSNKNKKKHSNNIQISTLFDHFQNLGKVNENGDKFDPRNCNIPENEQINKPFTKK